MKAITREEVMQVCKEMLQDRITHIQHAMLAAQEAANAEEKSSAGDKYETSRAMGQLDRDMNARQLEAAMQEMKNLNRLPVTAPIAIGNGSLISTDKGIYFIGIGIGKISIRKQDITVISHASPIASVFNGKKKGDIVMFRNLSMMIETIG